MLRLERGEYYTIMSEETRKSQSRYINYKRTE